MAVMKIIFNKKITMKIFIFLLIIFLVLLIYKVTIGVPKIETIKELDQLINIDLSNDYDCIYDIYSETKYNETEIVVYYEITEQSLNSKKYYQYNTDYNPLPSRTNNMLIDSIEDYLIKFNIDKNQINYMNCECAEYNVNKIFGVQSRPFEVNIYVLKSEDNENIKVLLSACVPYMVKIDIKDF